MGLLSLDHYHFYFLMILKAAKISIAVKSGSTVVIVVWYEVRTRIQFLIFVQVRRHETGYGIRDPLHVVQPR